MLIVVRCSLNKWSITVNKQKSILVCRRNLTDMFLLTFKLSNVSRACCLTQNVINSSLSDFTQQGKERSIPESSTSCDHNLMPRTEYFFKQTGKINVISVKINNWYSSVGMGGGES